MNFNALTCEIDKYFLLVKLHGEVHETMSICGDIECMFSTAHHEPMNTMNVTGCRINLANGKFQLNCLLCSPTQFCEKLEAQCTLMQSYTTMK